MWLGFGLITLIVGFVASLWTRSNAHWGGDKQTLTAEGQRLSYLFKLARNDKSKKLRKVWIGVDVPVDFKFAARREGYSDRFFKNIGISTEQQLRDGAFDDAVYLEADAAGVAQWLSSSVEMRTTMIELIGCSNKHRIGKLVVRCAHHRLWVECWPKQLDEMPYTAIVEMVALLHRLRTGMANVRFTAEQLHDPFIWRAALMLSISTATVALGFIGLLRGAAGRTDILDPWPLFRSCVIVGLALTAVFVVAVIKVLGRSSRTHLVLVEGVLIGSLGFAMATFALAREANVDLDFSAARVQELQGIHVEHEIRRSRKGGKNHYYYLYTADWRPEHAGEMRKLEIESHEFKLLDGKNEARLMLHPGALGYEWIERVGPVLNVE